MSKLLRMLRRLFRPRMCKLLLLFAVVVAAMWWRSRPLATLKLPDGTKIFLRRVTYGKELQFMEPFPQGATLWEKIKHAIRSPTAKLYQIYPSHVFQFTQRGPGGDREKRTSITDLEFVWEDGRSIPGQLVHEQGHTFWNHANLPRRGNTIPLRVSVGGARHRWEIPNPKAGEEFPAWAPAQFPQSSEAGDFKVAATGWRKKADQWDLDYELTFRGQKTAAPFGSANLEVWDATGNYSRLWDRGLYYSTAWLSSTEPAWKVRLTITAGAGEPLSPEHMVSFGKAHVPKVGKYTVFKIPPQIGTDRDYFAALLGPGQFGFRNGEFFNPQRERRLGARNECFIDWYAESWKVVAQRQTPGFILVDLTRAEPARWFADDIVFRFAAGGEGRPMQKLRTYSTDKAQSYTLKNAPKDGEIEIQALRTERFSVEFFVPPLRLKE